MLNNKILGEIHHTIRKNDKEKINSLQNKHIVFRCMHVMHNIKIFRMARKI